MAFKACLLALVALFSSCFFTSEFSYWATLASSDLPVASPALFPALRLKPLVGSEPLVLPHRKQCSFVALGFDPSQQGSLEAGLLAAMPLKQASATSVPWQVVELPVLDLKYLPQAGLIAPLMKLRVKNRQLLASVYPYYANLTAFKARFSLPASANRLFVAVNPSGQVLWQQSSIPSPATIQKLTQNLKGSCS